MVYFTESFQKFRLCATLYPSARVYSKNVGMVFRVPTIPNFKEYLRSRVEILKTFSLLDYGFVSVFPRLLLQLICSFEGESGERVLGV